jgi:L-alanine-DL-glutamate epimerase-like enolase superfamily enzyme
LTADLLVEPLRVVDGEMLLPDGAGLGVKIDEGHRARPTPGGLAPG